MKISSIQRKGNMIKRCQIILLVANFLLTIFDNASKISSAQVDIYGTLNERLIEAYPSEALVSMDDARANVELAVTHLKVTEGKEERLRWFCGENTTAQVEWLIESLDRVKEPLKCSLENVDLLGQIGGQVKLFARDELGRFLQLFSADRIQQVVALYTIDHLLTCPGAYTQAYEIRWSSLDEQTRRSIETFKPHSLARSSRASMETYHGQLTSANLHLAEDRQIALKTLLELARDDPDGKALLLSSGKGAINARGLKMLLDRYLVQPCIDYMEATGSGLFESVQFVGVNLDFNDSERLRKIYSTNFLLGFAHHRICKDLLRRRAELLNALIQIA